MSDMVTKRMLPEQGVVGGCVERSVAPMGYGGRAWLAGSEEIGRVGSV